MMAKHDVPASARLNLHLCGFEAEMPYADCLGYLEEEYRKPRTNVRGRTGSSGSSYFGVFGRSPAQPRPNPTSINGLKSFTG